MKRKLHEYQKRKILTIAFAVTAIIIIVVLYLRGDFSVEKIISYTPDNPWLAALFMIFLYAVKSVTIVFPVSVLHIASGVIFNPFIAVVINVIGMYVSLTIMYYVGFKSPTEKIDKKIQSYPKLKNIVEIQKGNDWFLCYFLRVISCLPFDAVSVYLGFLKIPYFKFIVGSMLGSFPGLVASTLLGTSIKDPTSPMFIISLSFIVLLSIVSLVLYLFKIKKEKAVD